MHRQEQDDGLRALPGDAHGGADAGIAPVHLHIHQHHVRLALQRGLHALGLGGGLPHQLHALPGADGVRDVPPQIGLVLRHHHADRLVLLFHLQSSSLALV